MQKILLTIFVLAFALGAFAQSARVKQKPEDKPKENRPRVVYSPTEAAANAPKPTPTPEQKTETEDVIRVESTLVPIPVSVLDARGQAVTNLRIGDFELFIDGERAEISDLARSEQPVRLALLFDNSSSVLIAREFEKKAAIRFFRRVIRPEKDLAALYSVSSGTRLEQPLTRDVSSLIRAIESFPQPQGATALLDGVVKAAKYLSEAQGRRVIVIVSDGVDTLSDTAFDDTVKAVQNGNCQVYVVKTTDFENFKRTGQRVGNANIRSLEAERRMQDLAAQTGGAVYSPIDEDELDRAFAQISAELSQQYVLSYYPEDEHKLGGRFRTITLTVKDRGDLNVRTRKGYYEVQNVK